MEELTQKELKELEQQLSCPRGTMGIEVGHRMNEFNIGMTLKTTSNLHLAEGMKVLELGHGNCGHLGELLNLASNLSYAGLEVSDTMLQEAMKLNQPFVKSKQAIFQIYNGVQIPFPENTFDRVFAVNTIYFWKEPIALLSEIKRVLKPEGKCLITYAQKAFMKDLPFIGDRFRLYDNEDLKELALSTLLQVEDFIDTEETTESKDGRTVKRAYSIAKLITTN